MGGHEPVAAANHAGCHPRAKTGGMGGPHPAVEASRAGLVPLSSKMADAAQAARAGPPLAGAFPDGPG
eukprot:4895067-Alexandrium_andersonii.AAC.1